VFFGAFLPESNRIEGKEVNKMMKMTEILKKKEKIRFKPARTC
jgi:hypothetical protein